jgi:ABC-type antimicrobial peptide transport system permease subunit
MTSPSCDQIGPGYFATMGIPILLGREFSDQDRSGRASVCIINETLAQKYFPGKSPIGQHIYFGIDAKGVPDVEIVGVVKTVRVNSVREERPAFTYRPLLQNADNSEVTCYLRTTVDPAATANMVRGAVQGEDHNLSAYGLVSAEEEKERLFSGDRMLAYLATAFGVLATLLAALGLYGAVSYTVIRRTREIGVRVALGADQANILRLILRDVVLVIAGAIAIAIPVAYGAEQFIKSMLYGLSGFEATFALLATGILALVALAAGLIPARRATRVNPVEALRME